MKWNRGACSFVLSDSLELGYYGLFRIGTRFGFIQAEPGGIERTNECWEKKKPSEGRWLMFAIPVLAGSKGYKKTTTFIVFLSSKDRRDETRPCIHPRLCRVLVLLGYKKSSICMNIYGSIIEIIIEIIIKWTFVLLAPVWRDQSAQGSPDEEQRQELGDQQYLDILPRLQITIEEEVSSSICL